jgi:hypothetical protein
VRPLSCRPVVSASRTLDLCCSGIPGIAGNSHTCTARPLRVSQNEGRQEPALRGGREAPSSSGRRRRRATRRTRRSVSIAPPQAGRGTECDLPEALPLRRRRRIPSAGVIRSRPSATFLLAVSLDDLTRRTPIMERAIGRLRTEARTRQKQNRSRVRQRSSPEWAETPAKDAGNDNCYDFGFRGMTE